MESPDAPPASLTEQPTEEPLARCVANALEFRLTQANTDIHWVAVVGESSLAPKPTARWTDHERDMLLVTFHRGPNEGWLAYVSALSNRYAPATAKPQLCCKFLGGLSRFGSALTTLYQLVEEIEDDPKDFVARAAEDAGPARSQAWHCA